MTISAVATAISGRLTKKIQRQFQFSTMMPPASGPRIEAMPQMPLMMPCILARCSAGKITPTTMNDKRVDRAAAETLNGAKDDHRLHALGRAAQRRAEEKNRRCR